MIVEKKRGDDDDSSSSSSSSSDSSDDDDKPQKNDKFWIIMCNRDSKEHSRLLNEISTLFFKIMVKVPNE